MSTLDEAREVSRRLRDEFSFDLRAFCRRSEEPLAGEQVQVFTELLARWGVLQAELAAPKPPAVWNPAPSLLSLPPGADRWCLHMARTVVAWHGLQVYGIVLPEEAQGGPCPAPPEQLAETVRLRLFEAREYTFRAERDRIGDLVDFIHDHAGETVVFLTRLYHQPEGPTA